MGMEADNRGHAMSRQSARFAFIEAMLLKHRFISRTHVMRAFHLGPAAATKLLSEYQEAHPEAMHYSLKEKRYVIGNKCFDDNMRKHCDSAEQFLNAIELIAGQSILQTKTF